ncbi:MAG: hypothetical protein CMM29_09800 [Rhodospirillaceae bacterium]|nr:hypothetical protein [Rhodospirillaceae bacterium]|tara:strand:- start:4831 stop:5196 length:366 start_codon:yes stop_codon:yes gene_type:complete
MKIHDQYIDLAPTIIRKRLVIEGISSETFTKESMNKYMIELSKLMNMTIVSEPSFNFDIKYGLSSYMCWKESGMHIYTWEKNNDRPNFFSIDIYTCKDFDVSNIIKFTSNSFSIEELTWKY